MVSDCQLKREPGIACSQIVRARFVRDTRRTIQTYFRTDALYCAYAIPKTDERYLSSPAIMK